MNIEKHPHLVSRTDTALLIVDVQEKFQPAIPGFDDIVSNAVKLTQTFRMFGMPIMITEQYPRGLGRTVRPILDQIGDLQVVEKLECACTSNGHFANRLSLLNARSVVVCGVETHVCVNQTVHGLLQASRIVHPVCDAMGSRSRLDHDVALLKMHAAGAIPATTEMVLFELAEVAGTEEFKNVQKLVKSRTAGSVPAART